MSVHEQRESESTHADRLDEAQGTNRAKVGNEQSNYQAVAGETIFLLRFLPPPPSPMPEACKTFSTYTRPFPPCYPTLIPIHTRLQNADHGFTGKLENTASLI